MDKNGDFDIDSPFVCVNSEIKDFQTHANFGANFPKLAHKKSKS